MSTPEHMITRCPDVGELVGRLRTIQRSAKLALAMDVGRLIVHALYNGDVQELRKRRRAHDGYRELAEHPDLPMTTSTLWHYVRVYELTSRLEWVVSSSLTVAHLTAVLGKNPVDQGRLLAMAETKGWSSAALAKAVGAKAPSGTDAAPVMSAVRTVERLDTDPTQFGRARALSEEERRRVRMALQRTRAWCEALEAWLRDGDDVN